MIDNAIKYSPNKEVIIKNENEDIIFENQGRALAYPFEKYFEPFFSNEDKSKSYPTNLSKVKKEDFELISEHGKLVTEALAYAYDFNDSNENFH